MSDAINDVINEVIAAYGSVANAQAALGYQQPMGIYNWRSRGIPRALIPQIHLDTKIPIQRLVRAVKYGPAAA